MAEKVVIALSCGTNDTNRATRAIHLATIAHKEGKDTCVFLLDEGVYLAKEGIITHVRAATGDGVQAQMVLVAELVGTGNQHPDTLPVHVFEAGTVDAQYQVSDLVSVLGRDAFAAADGGFPSGTDVVFF